MEIRSVPRNLHKAPETVSERPGLAAEPQAVKDAARAMRAQGVGLNVPNVDAPAQEVIVLEVDPQVCVKGLVLAANLADSPAVEAASGVSGAAVGGKCRRLQGMLTLCEITRQVSSDADDSLTVAAQRQRKLQQGVGDLCERILAGKEPQLVKAHPGLLERVRVHYGRVQAKQQKFADALAARVQDTKNQGKKAEEAVAAASNRELLVRTMLDLRQGKHVDAAQLQTALDTFDALQEQAAAATTAETPAGAAAGGNRRDLKRTVH